MAISAPLVVLAAVAVHGASSLSSFVTHPIAAGKSSLDASVLTVGTTSDIINDSHAHINGHIVRVSNPKGRLSVVEPLPGGCGTTALVSQTAELYKPKCKLAVNAGYYDLKNRWNCIGNVVSDSRIVQKGNFSQRNVNFGVKDGQWIIGYISPEEIQSGGYEQLVEGMGWIVHEGKNWVDQGWKEAYHGAGSGGEEYASTTSGRTGVGYDSQGQLLILQFDGHTGTPSWGATMSQLADTMIELGAVEAINLDGGGSTQMVYEGVSIGYSSDRTSVGALVGQYDPDCPIGTGEGNLSRFECQRRVSTILCIHEDPEISGSDSAGLLALGVDLPCWLPHAMVAAAALVVIATIVLHLRRATLQDRAKLFLQIHLFTGAQQFTDVILDSHRLSQAAQAMQSFSGFYIGCFYIGAIIAGICVWRSLRHHPQSWRKWTGSAYFPAAVLLLTSGMLLTVVERQLAFATVAPHSSESTLAQLMLCLVQLFSGAGKGMATQCSLVLLVKLTPVEQRPSAMAGAGLAAMLGAGSGPFMAALMDGLNLCSSAPEINVGTVGPEKVLVAVMLLALVIFSSPDLVGAVDHSVKPFSASQEEDRFADAERSLKTECSSSSYENTNAIKRRLILGAFVCTALRGYILSSLEAGTSLLLEVEYGWRARSTGLAVSATLFTCIPVNAVYKRLTKSMPVIQWVRGLAFVGLAGSLFLFSGVSSTFEAMIGQSTAGSMLLIADAFVFPCIYQADVLQRGIMTQNLLPEGSCFDSNHAGAWQMLAWLANAISPFGSRLLVANCGQNLYAVQQLFLIVLFLVVSRTTVQKGLVDLEE